MAEQDLQDDLYKRFIEKFQNIERRKPSKALAAPKEEEDLFDLGPKVSRRGGPSRPHQRIDITIESDKAEDIDSILREFMGKQIPPRGREHFAPPLKKPRQRKPVPLPRQQRPPSKPVPLPNRGRPAMPEPLGGERD